MKLSNKMYDCMKYFSMVFLPAFITFYGVLGATCGFPYVQETLTIMVAFNTFLGTLLGVSSAQYHKGEEIDD